MTGMPPDPAYAFLKVTNTHLDDLLALSIAPEERHLISDIPGWLAEAALLPVPDSFGVFHRSQAVGLLSVVDPRLIDEEDDRSHFQPGCLYVWRVVTDHRHRGQRHGTATLEFAERYARLIGLTGLSLTTKDKDPKGALPFYQKLGFTPTGRRLDDEMELIKAL